LIHGHCVKSRGHELGVVVYDNENAKTTTKNLQTDVAMNVIGGFQNIINECLTYFL
jgi:hypothetical protein